MKYAHLFNGRKRGTFDLYITETPSLVGSELFKTFANQAEAKQAVRSIGAKPWNYVDAKAERAAKEASK